MWMRRKLKRGEMVKTREGALVTFLQSINPVESQVITPEGKTTSIPTNNLDIDMIDTSLYERI